MATFHGAFVRLGRMGLGYPTVVEGGPYAAFDEEPTTDITPPGEEITVPTFGDTVHGHLRAMAEGGHVDVYRDGDVVGFRFYDGVPDVLPVRAGQKLTFKAAG